MAKARFAKGLRRGSTRSETYSTLNTYKDGRVQIIKDRVYEVKNPQSDSQMVTRVVFSTVTSAAKHMLSIVGISYEGITNIEFARQQFISRNIKELRKVSSYPEIGAVLAAYAPKSNTQLIPNSYIMSSGSLLLPSIWMPKTNGSEGASFLGDDFAVVTPTAIAVPYGKYTSADMWDLLFGLRPGDQITVPQIWGSQAAQVLYAGATPDTGIIDKTLVTTFAAPRLVLLSDMPSTEIVIGATSDVSDIADLLRLGINQDRSYQPLVSSFFSFIEPGTTTEADSVGVMITGRYCDWLGVAADVDTIRAMAVILSHRDGNKWRYSNSKMVCVWKEIDAEEGSKYFGFTLSNAIATYLKGFVSDGNGNFLQRGSDNNIVPPFV